MLCVTVSIMPVRREARGEYLIEASAFHLPVGDKWQPRLTMTRLNAGNKHGKMQSFPGLKPEFDTAKAAVSYALALGRQMAEQGSSRLTV